MAGKLSFIIGLGAGYVLGARSGRERYDQIAEKAQELWRDPRVKEKAGQAQQVVAEKAGQAGQVVKEKAASATSTNGDAAGGRSGSHPKTATPGRKGSTGTTGAQS
jgi:SLT domain-containing protein